MQQSSKVFFKNRARQGKSLAVGFFGERITRVMRPDLSPCLNTVFHWSFVEIHVELDGQLDGIEPHPPSRSIEIRNKSVPQFISIVVQSTILNSPSRNLCRYPLMSAEWLENLHKPEFWHSTQRAERWWAALESKKVDLHWCRPSSNSVVHSQERWNLNYEGSFTLRHQIMQISNLQIHKVLEALSQCNRSIHSMMSGSRPWLRFESNHRGEIVEHYQPANPSHI